MYLDFHIDTTYWKKKVYLYGECFAWVYAWFSKIFFWKTFFFIWYSSKVSIQTFQKRKFEDLSLFPSTNINFCSTNMNLRTEDEVEIVTVFHSLWKSSPQFTVKVEGTFLENFLCLFCHHRFIKMVSRFKKKNPQSNKHRLLYYDFEVLFCYFHWRKSCEVLDITHDKTC